MLQNPAGASAMKVECASFLLLSTDLEAGRRGHLVECICSVTVFKQLHRRLCGICSSPVRTRAHSSLQ